ncbi:hypothetical protein [Burkholderia gladioli]|uniref:hypothetical protein n=1 Tax=Burkholderia gladioli TaxID=28095 RepID=UPI00163E7DF8|nr:hypothetical protein [Burkholderia gladioli]
MTNNTTASMLTDEQIDAIANDGHRNVAGGIYAHHVHDFARDVERALVTFLRETVVRPGWKLVPIEPTEDMIVNGFESWPDQFFSKPEVWASFERMSGCQRAAHKAKLCYSAMLDAAPAAQVAEAVPIPMLLFCPRCGAQHIDAPETVSDSRPVLYADAWTNPPHRSHLCHACGIVWRPADVATVGVASIETSGKADTWTKETPWIGHNRPVAQAVAADGSQVKDVVTREQAEAWARQAGIHQFTELGLARLVDFAIFARAAASPATADRRHVGDSQFESWYPVYIASAPVHVSIEQRCRDAYAAGMSHATPQPVTADERAAMEAGWVKHYGEPWHGGNGLVRGIWGTAWKQGIAWQTSASQAAAPTFQQISDYLHMLDAVQREVVEREARALEPTQGAWFAKTQAAAPAEAREPSRVGRADIVDGRVQSFAFEQTDIPTGIYSLYTAPGVVPADAGEAVAWICSGSNDFAPIVRDRDAALRLSQAHGDGKIVALGIVPDVVSQGAQGGKGGEA